MPGHQRLSASKQKKRKTKKGSKTTKYMIKKRSDRASYITGVEIELMSDSA
jgi:hypothetical protein